MAKRDAAIDFLQKLTKELETTVQRASDTAPDATPATAPDTTPDTTPLGHIAGGGASAVVTASAIVASMAAPGTAVATPGPPKRRRSGQPRDQRIQPPSLPRRSSAAELEQMKVRRTDLYRSLLSSLA